MSAIKSIIARLYRDDRGATMVEYSILIGLITAATIGFIGTVSGEITDAWTTLSNAMAPPPATP